MPTLEWIGKSKVINHHQDVPFRVLERKYSFDENGQHNEDNGSENMIIRGDNLEALKALLPGMRGASSASTSIRPTTPATRAGSTTTMSMTRRSRSGWARLSAKRARTCPPRQMAVHDVPALEATAKAAGG